MKIDKQKEVFEETISTMREIMFKKGNDYAGEDRLSNFKLSGAICGLSAEQHCLALIAVKVARLGQLISAGKTPNNESIEDSIIDLGNYTLLLKMILADKPKVGSVSPSA